MRRYDALLFLAMKRTVGSVVVLCAFLDRYINSAKNRKTNGYMDHLVPGVLFFLTIAYIRSLPITNSHR